MPIVDSIMNTLFPEYLEKQKLYRQQDINHNQASEVMTKQTKDLYPEYTLDSIYAVEVIQDEQKDTKYLFTEIKYDEHEKLAVAFRSGEGLFFLLDDKAKKKMLPHSIFKKHGRIRQDMLATQIGKTIPDFLYELDGAEYIVNLKRNYTPERIEEKNIELERLYRYLFTNIGKKFEIDPDFETYTCYEVICTLKYFRLTANQLYMVIEHNGKTISHLFDHIGDIGSGESLGEKAIKFTLYTPTYNYRFYLYKQGNEHEVDIDSGIFKVSKDLL